MAPANRRIAVVGAGLTGLAAAHRIHVDAPDVELVVLEASERTGGKILTSDIAGITLDEAADAFLARVPEGLDLCRELGLDDQLVSPAARSAFVYSHGAMRRLPDGLVLGVPTDLDAVAASGIVSAEGIARAAEDLDRAGQEPTDLPADGADESVGALVRRRLGDEVADRLVGPLLGGVNAGDFDQLSVAAGAPQLAAAARTDASLIAALRAQRAATPADPDAPVFFGLPGGTGTLLDALVASLPPGTVRTGTPVTSIQPRPGGGLHINTPNQALDVDAVVLAVPAGPAGRLVAGIPGLLDVSDGLASVPWASVVMTTLVLPRDAVTHPLDGSGVLLPTAERRFVTACSFASSKWAHIGGPDEVVLRVSTGHAGDGGAALALDDATIVRLILDDLDRLIGLDGAPTAVRVSRWPEGLPQYRPGHLDRAAAWQQQAWDMAPGLWMIGASFAGLGLPACIRQGHDAARRALAV